MSVSLQGNSIVRTTQALQPEPDLPVTEPQEEAVPSLVITEAEELLIEADFSAKKAVIDNLKPSEREIKLRKEAQKAAREKAQDAEDREKEIEEKRLEKEELERHRNLMV